MSDSQDILVPDIGDFDSVDVIEVLVSPGDTVDVESPLITLESDKATMDVILTGNKDPWNPTPEVYEKSLSTLQESIRVLKPKGTFISISFSFLIWQLYLEVTQHKFA